MVSKASLVARGFESSPGSSLTSNLHEHEDIFGFNIWAGGFGASGSWLLEVFLALQRLEEPSTLEHGDIDPLNKVPFKKARRARSRVKKGPP